MIKYAGYMFLVSNELKCFSEAKLRVVGMTGLGILRNDDGNVYHNGSEKSHFWFTLSFFARVIWALFSSP